MSAPDVGGEGERHPMSPAHEPVALLNETTYRELLDLAPDGIVAVDGSGRMLLANVQAHRLFDYPPGTLVGQAVDVLLPAALRGVHAGHRAGYMASPRPRPMGAGLDLIGLPSRWQRIRRGDQLEPDPDGNQPPRHGRHPRHQRPQAGRGPDQGPQRGSRPPPGRAGRGQPRARSVQLLRLPRSPGPLARSRRVQPGARRGFRRQSRTRGPRSPAPHPRRRRPHGPAHRRPPGPGAGHAAGDASGGGGSDRPRPHRGRATPPG